MDIGESTENSWSFLSVYQPPRLEFKPLIFLRGRQGHEDSRINQTWIQYSLGEENIKRIPPYLSLLLCRSLHASLKTTAWSFFCISWARLSFCCLSATLTFVFSRRELQHCHPRSWTPMRCKRCCLCWTSPAGQSSIFEAQLRMGKRLQNDFLDVGIGI